MITIVTALYCEAKPVIDKYELRRDESIHQFQVFASDEIRVLITGTGKMQAAIAVSIVLTAYPPTPKDCLINIGICAGQDKEMSRGTICYCHSIQEDDTGRTYYPDMIYAHDLLEVNAITVSRPYHSNRVEYSKMNPNSKRQSCQKFNQEHNQELIQELNQESIKDFTQISNDEVSIYEMEAAGIYQAAEHFLHQHQIVFLKVVSDYGDPDMTPDIVTDLIDKNLDKVETLMHQIRRTLDAMQEDQKLSERLDKLKTRLTRDLHCSEFMEHQLQQYLRYGLLSGEPLGEEIERSYDKGELPCKDKKEGKRRFEQLKKCWIS